MKNFVGSSGSRLGMYTSTPSSARDGSTSCSRQDATASSSPGLAIHVTQTV